MTDEPYLTDGDGLSRRSVLKRGALGGGALVVGTGAFSTTAAATECPRTPGYWKTHEWFDIDGDGDEDVPRTLREIFGFASPSEGRSFLAEKPRGNKWQIISEQFVATVLNFQVRNADDPDCVDQEVFVDGIGTTTIREVKRASQRWIGLASDPTRKWDSTTVSVETTSGSTTVGGEVLKDALDGFNNARFDALDCGCGGSDDPPTDPIAGGNARGGGKGRGAGEKGRGGNP